MHLNGNSSLSYMADCGVAAVVYKRSAQGNDFRAYRALQLLLEGVQHRGPLGCGVCTDDDSGKLNQHKDLGLVLQVLDRMPLMGPRGIGMVRYGTTGLASEGSNTVANRMEARSRLLDEQQPFHHRDRNRYLEFSFSFNGQLTNYRLLRSKFEKYLRFRTGTDTEVLEVVIAEELKKNCDSKPNLASVFSEVVKKIEGCYNIVFIDGAGRIAALRDPHEFRPFVYADTDHLFAAASETGALENLLDINGHNVEFIKPGELLVYENELQKYKIANPEPHICLFEMIYFMNVVNRLPNNSSAFNIRRKMGEEMAFIEPLRSARDFKEYVVVAVPDTARTMAHSFAKTLGLEFDGDGIIKDPFAGRAFLMDPSVRQQRLDIKYKVIPGVVNGKKVIVFDDSVVRGDASLEIVRRLLGAGAREVHFRVSYPPIKHPCFYGIDFPVQEKLLAYRMGCDRGIAELESNVAEGIKANSFKYPSLEMLLRVAAKEMERKTTEYCHACISGQYPVEIKL